MMLRSIGLFFALISLGSTIGITSYSSKKKLDKKWDHFEFDITFYCNALEREEYNLMIEWWESDTIPGMEQITRSKFYRAKTGNFSFSMDGAMDGDEPGSDGYKPVAYITHDCERRAETVELELVVTTLCEIGSSCHYRIVQDITSTRGTKEIVAKDLKLNDFTPYPDFKRD